MKKLINYISLAAFTVVMASSCEKDERKVFLESGTNPVLTSQGEATQVLIRGNQNNIAVTFNWTNPEYKFTTGVSSHDVTYILQADTTGANFTSNRLAEVSIARDLSKAFTVKELNGILNRMELEDGVAKDIDFRIKAALVNGTVMPLYSNVIKMKLTPYLDVAVPVPTTNKLYITGDATASSWTNNPPETQRLTRVSITEYTITLPLASGKLYKFLSTSNQWQPQYGLKPGSGGDANGGELGLNDGSTSDPDAIPTPAAAGNYKITLNFRTGKYSVTRE
jgi:hypothetical protein